MIHFNANAASSLPNMGKIAQEAGNATAKKVDFADTIKAVEKYISNVDDTQVSSCI